MNNKNYFKNKNILILGASGGIGHCVAKLMDENGANLCLHHHSNVIDSSLIKNHLILNSDLTSDKSCELLVKKCLKRHIRLDGMVNCIGGIIRPSNWEDINESTLLETFKTNFFPAFFISRELLKQQKNTNGMSLVNISSTFGVEIGNPNIIGYGSSKAALDSMTRSLAKIGAQCGTRVNGVSPGLVNTDMTKSSPKTIVDKAILETPMNRMATPEEIAQVCEFLLSDSSKFITGQTIIVDGGHVLR